MNIRKSNTNIFQTQQNPETKYTQTPTQMKIQKPNTKLFQTKQHPEITDTRTHTNKHTTTQYKHMSNKNKSGNTIHKNPQAWPYKDPIQTYFKQNKSGNIIHNNLQNEHTTTQYTYFKQKQIRKYNAQTPSTINIQTPSTKICQTHTNPEIKNTTTHKHEHSKTQYKHILNKQSGNKRHRNPQHEHTKTQYNKTSNNTTSRNRIHKHQHKITHKHPLNKHIK